MATNTSHLGLVKPAYTDAADVAVINNNMDTIDTAISHILPVITGSTNNSGYTIATGHYFEANGSVYKATASIGTGSSWSGNASAVSGTALNAAFDSLSDNIEKVQNGLAYIVGDTNTTGSTIEVGSFVYVKGHATISEGLRKVTANISANGNITTNNTEACPEGGLNTLQESKLDKFSHLTQTFTKENADGGSYEYMGTITLNTGLWLITVEGVWNSGKPLGIHVAIGNTTTDNPEWSTESDSGNPRLSFAITISSMTLSIFAKGGSTKQVKVDAYKMTTNY